MSHGERRLAALAAALIGNVRVLSPRERRLLKPKIKLPAAVVAVTRKHIRAGGDPLGETFCAVRSPERRRSVGATYTPPPIINAMVAWSVRECPTASRIVDAGAGSGRFTVAAAKAFPKARLVAIETDPLATLMLRANAAVLGFADRLDVILDDYRNIALPRIAGRTLYLGNPPYVRHHQISERWKTWFARAARDFDLTASKLAGLHIHFFMKTRTLAQPGDCGVFITAAEWIDVNYGSVLRTMLADGLGGTSLHVIDPKAQPFADALTTAAITSFHVGNRPDAFTVAAVDSLSELASLSHGRSIDWSKITGSRKWSAFLRAPLQAVTGTIELGELFRVHRGQVSGKNSVWIAGAAAADLPSRYLFPTITKARELFAAGDVLRSTKHLRRVIDLPIDLAELDSEERRAVDKFLRWARAHGAADSYVAQHRRAWWSVEMRKPPLVLCTYMARRVPAFVRNAAGARFLNIAHGLYPREPLPDKTLAAILAYLKRCITLADGRTYAGGLVKFEPGELERLRIPALENLHGDPGPLDSEATRKGRGDSASELPHNATL
jgi:adenine-specific DNA-methyltransferase